MACSRWGCCLSQVCGAGSLRNPSPDTVVAIAGWEDVTDEEDGLGIFQIALLDELSRLNQNSLKAHREVKVFEPSLAKER